MKPSELRDKSPGELTKMTAEIEEEIFKLKVRKGLGEFKQTSAIKKTKRDLARVKTVIRERTLKA